MLRKNRFQTDSNNVFYMQCKDKILTFIAKDWLLVEGANTVWGLTHFIRERY